jgi:hypothetical protein
MEYPLFMIFLSHCIILIMVTRFFQCMIQVLSTFDYYANKIILYDGVSVSDFASSVTSNFVIDSVNTIYFLRNDSIIKYRNGLTLLKTKLPFTTVIYDPVRLVYTKVVIRFIFIMAVIFTPTMLIPGVFRLLVA